MSNAKETKVEDHDYSLQPVPQFARRRLLTMFMIMLGFTFFSASMWTGQTLGDSLDLSGFIGSLILGGIILAIYTGSLAYVGAKTGLSLDLLAQHSFGAKGSYLPSVLTSFTPVSYTHLDCKYGISMNGNALELTLLRAAAAPEMHADNREHHFTYGFTAWEGSFADSDVVRQGYEKNVKPVITAGVRCV